MLKIIYILKTIAPFLLMYLSSSFKLFFSVTVLTIIPSRFLYLLPVISIYLAQNHRFLSCVPFYLLSYVVRPINFRML